MNAKYLIGIPDMDAQHAKIYELAVKAQSKYLTDVEMQVLLVELLEYAKHHLEEEEKFLAARGLSDFLKGHVGLHTQFRARAMDIYHQFREGETEEDRRKILHAAAEFCENWLLHHIDVEDRKYAELLKSQKA